LEEEEEYDDEDDDSDDSENLSEYNSDIVNLINNYTSIKIKKEEIKENNIKEKKEEVKDSNLKENKEEFNELIWNEFIKTNNGNKWKKIKLENGQYYYGNKITKKSQVKII
jgi:hypothetical protein